MERERPLQSIPDDELLSRLADLLRQSRHDEADLVAHIGEVDERRLYAREASPSMFAYCTEVLHLSEAEAYLRIAAARAARAHPILLTMLSDGRLHLTGIAKLAPHLTPENASTLLSRATHRSKAQILELLAEVFPRPDAPTVVRKLPERLAPASPVAPVASAAFAAFHDPTEEVGPAVFELRPDQVHLPPDEGAPGHSAPQPRRLEPLAPGRYKVQFTASAGFLEKLDRLQALMGARSRGGDVATILEAAVTEKLERLESRRLAKAKAPRKTLRDARIAPATRHIPAAVRRAVFERDGGRCGYADERGRRCTERKRLEFHHRYPFGRGGDHSPGNIGLVCPSHNAWLAEHDYGRDLMERQRAPQRGQGAPDATTTPSGTASEPRPPCSRAGTAKPVRANRWPRTGAREPEPAAQ